MRSSASHRDHSGPRTVLRAEGANGTPVWITPELIQITLKVWQPRYKAQLSEDDARIIFLSVGHLVEALSRSGPRR
jgi:hypothetical protein